MKKLSSVFLTFTLIISLTGCFNHATHSEEQTRVENQITFEEQTDNTNETPQTHLTADSSFTVHFIDVGQADAALVCCDDETMLIDGGNAADSNLIAAYLKKYNINYLNYIVCSHADEDHVGGLSGALSVVPAGCVYAPKTESSSKAYQNFKNKVNEQNLQIQHPQHGAEISLGSSTVKFLAPIHENYDDRNNTSIVLKIIYGSTSFLFTGDAEREEEYDIIQQGHDLSATVLKVGHHGSASSTSYLFLREIMPEYAVISVGKGNSYGHPTEEVLSRLRDSRTKVFRTDLQGDIIAVSDGNNVTVTPSKNADTDTLSSVRKEENKAYEPKKNYADNSSVSLGNYIGNKNSKKFHLPSCSSLPKENNRIYFSSREDALNNGFIPCKICNP